MRDLDGELEQCEKSLSLNCKIIHLVNDKRKAE